MLTSTEEFRIKFGWLIIAGVLLGGCILFFYLGATLEIEAGQDAMRALFNSLGGALLTIAVIDVFHEFFVARDFRHQFKILEDFKNNGVERVCTQQEINEYGADQLRKTSTFKGIGMGFQWLLDDDSDSLTHNFIQLRRILLAQEVGKHVLILVPDPCEEQLLARYRHDEPSEPGYRYLQGPEGLAKAIRKWWALQADFPGKLVVRIYRSYPMANVNVYDKYVFVSPVLFKRRVKDGLTAVYKRDSRGARIYEDHISKTENEGSIALDESYIRKLNTKYPVAKA